MRMIKEYHSIYNILHGSATRNRPMSETVRAVIRALRPELMPDLHPPKTRRKARAAYIKEANRFSKPGVL
jgi:hypothetical protein